MGCCESKREITEDFLDEKLLNNEYAFPVGYDLKDTMEYFNDVWSIKESQ